MFEKRHNYIICVDSDGCAIDSMTIKHQRCFGPEMIKVWNLQEHKKEMQKICIQLQEELTVSKDLCLRLHMRVKEDGSKKSCLS